MPLCFAYGSNMDAAAMSRRCPRARPLGRGRLARWRFIVTPSGFASVAPDPRACVYGVLWDIPVAEIAALDRYEQVAQGLYAKRNLPILREPFGFARALVYICADPGRGAAWPGYLEEIVAAARAQALPQAYVDGLASLPEARARALCR